MKSVMWLTVVAGLIYWLFWRDKASASTGVIQPDGPDFDSITADQLAGAAAGDVSIGDEWSATFVHGSGDWSDAYRSHAAEPDEPGGIPL
jgi:hypothetical protein